MSTDRPLVLGPNQFLIGYQPQREWAWLIATAFFLGKVGAGLFLISYFSDFRLGAVVGLLIVGVGKTTAHLLYLGRPLRFLRAVVGWHTSWISRGIIAMGVFLACGAVYVAPTSTSRSSPAVSRAPSGRGPRSRRPRDGLRRLRAQGEPGRPALGLVPDARARAVLRASRRHHA